MGVITGFYRIEKTEAEQYINSGKLPELIDLLSSGRSGKYLGDIDKTWYEIPVFFRVINAEKAYFLNSWRIFEGASADFEYTYWSDWAITDVLNDFFEFYINTINFDESMYDGDPEFKKQKIESTLSIKLEFPPYEAYIIHLDSLPQIFDVLWSKFEANFPSISDDEKILYYLGNSDLSLDIDVADYIFHHFKKMIRFFFESNFLIRENQSEPPQYIFRLTR
jgi:hypothetical protein